MLPLFFVGVGHDDVGVVPVVLPVAMVLLLGVVVPVLGSLVLMFLVLQVVLVLLFLVFLIGISSCRVRV